MNIHYVWQGGIRPTGSYVRVVSVLPAGPDTIQVCLAVCRCTATDSGGAQCVRRQHPHEPDRHTVA